MAPQQVICLPAFPMTTNGKVDRAKVVAELESLRAAARVSSCYANGQSVSLDSMQSRIAEIRATVLGLTSSKSLSPASDFFALGGDSRLIALAVARMRREIDEAAELAWEDSAPRDGVRSHLGRGCAGGAEVRAGIRVRPPSGNVGAVDSPLVYLVVGQ